MRSSTKPILFGVALVACGGSTPGGKGAEHSDAPRDERSLAGALVYDASGQRKACAPPKKKCPPKQAPREFLDQCRLKGYQLRRCGCETVCSGQAIVAKEYYNARGQRTECLPEDPGCTPPETSAAFQDACTEARHRLVVCGCEWLCDGPLKGAD